MTATVGTSADIVGHIALLRELRPDLAACLDVLESDALQPIEAGPHRRLLDRLLQVLTAAPATPEHAWRAAVLVNMFAVISRGAAADYENLVTLVGFSRKAVAQVQDEFDTLVGSRPDRPLSTALIVRLARGRHVKQALVDAGRAATEAESIATNCAKSAFWLLMAGVDSTTPGPIPRSHLDLRLIIETQGVTAWRRLLANVAANPWGPAAKGLAELARGAELTVPAQVIEDCARHYRGRAENAERLEVANEIRQIVATSGYSQRQFARHVGTSAPRLSTYINGVVTPSASMLLRMNKFAASLAVD